MVLLKVLHIVVEPERGEVLGVISSLGTREAHTR